MKKIIDLSYSLDTVQAAAYLTKSGYPCKPRTLESLRSVGNKGPKYLRLSYRRVRYSPQELDKFVKAKIKYV